MLDVKLIREDRARVAAALGKRLPADEVDESLDRVLELDERRRALVGEVGELRRRRNESARAIGEAKRTGRPLPDDLDPQALKKELEAVEDALREVEDALHEHASRLPNLPADDVVAGGKEANRVLATWGEQPALPEPRSHVDLATDLGVVDFERGVKLGGAGFWMYTGLGARLEWALVNWFVERHVAAGYTFLLPPHLLLHAAGFAAGQFPKFRDDVYHLQVPEDGRGQFLLPTAETAILGAYQDEIMDAGDLPLRAFAYTPCYRRERAGTHADERGTVRGHQFNKVEIFQFVTPEDGLATLEEMVGYAQGLVRDLGLHHRVSLLAAGDMSEAMRKTIDIEVWLPSVGVYKEVSSVSWAGDYQARRARIRYRAKGDKKPAGFVHTLNGSALATSRLFPAILEQFQQPDGSVLVPEVLRDALGTDRLTRSGRLQ